MTKKEFAEKLRDFCLANGFEIAGTCFSEGIYGEITVHAVDEEKNWNNWDEKKFNLVDSDNGYFDRLL